MARGFREKEKLYGVKEKERFDFSNLELSHSSGSEFKSTRFDGRLPLWSPDLRGELELANHNPTHSNLPSRSKSYSPSHSPSHSNSEGKVEVNLNQKRISGKKIKIIVSSI
jgi:hypothetical protein